MSGEIPAGCVYDVWGADYGVQAGARCLNSDAAHQAAHHGGPETEDGELVREPWRFDVPEVAATAIKDRDGDVWLLVRSGRWADAVEVERGQPYPDYAFVDLLAFAPLMECEDPRKEKP